MSSTYTLSDCAKMHLYGTFKNNWRRRTVSVYKHPTYPNSVVITVGVPMDGGEPVICEEDIVYYCNRINNNDWQAYN
jgi:hypothetical protein